jgi:hypothetical protein
MWDGQKSKRFQDLRQVGRQLSTSEEAELQSLVEELYAAEAAYLKPATERLRQENDRTEGQNAELDRLIERKQALVHRLKAVLAETRAEQQAIQNELATVLAASADADREE